MLDDNVRIPSSRVAVVEGVESTMTRSWFLFLSNLYEYFVALPYGSFYDTGTQTAAANTSTAITFNSSGDKRNVSTGTPTSRIMFTVGGATSVTFSIQFTNSSATQDDVYAWIRKNGTDVPNTASAVTVPGKHGSIDGASLMTVNFHVIIAPGEYLEVYWLSINGTTKISTIGATSSPQKPASPGVVLTVSQVL